MSADAPVAVFDSGIGGLSVAREVRRLLPAEPLLYLADNAYVPYGDRTPDEVRIRSVAVGEWMERQGAKVLVVACNTASGAALEALRERLAIPVVGLEPAVKPAVRATRTGKVGVMATVGTLRSERFARLVKNHANGAQVIPQPCPGLADLIEDGHLGDDLLRERLRDFTAPLKAAGVDTVVLGCTHYLFVRDAIAEALGPGVHILDSGEAIARRVRQVLGEAGTLAEGGAGRLRFLTTGDPAEAAPVVERIWGEPLSPEHVTIDSPGVEPTPVPAARPEPDD
jgi:glutamate racemase